MRLSATASRCLQPQLLEHIEDDYSILGQLYGCLMPGARLYIYVPAFQILYSAMDRHVGHLRRYRRGELVAKGRAAGFVIERSGYCDSLGFLASLAYIAIGNKDGSIDRRSLVFYDRFLFPVSRWLDLLLGSFVAKNAWVTARKPDASVDRMRAVVP